MVPFFNARQVDYRSNCIPNQLQVGGTQLKAEMLIADPPPPTAPGAPPSSQTPPPPPRATAY